jgi:hypothetical protein
VSYTYETQFLPFRKFPKTAEAGTWPQTAQQGNSLDY